MNFKRNRINKKCNSNRNLKQRICGGFMKIFYSKLQKAWYVPMHGNHHTFPELTEKLLKLKF